MVLSILNCPQRPTWDGGQEVGGKGQGGSEYDKKIDFLFLSTCFPSFHEIKLGQTGVLQSGSYPVLSILNCLCKIPHYIASGLFCVYGIQTNIQ